MYESLQYLTSPVEPVHLETPPLFISSENLMSLDTPKNADCEMETPSLLSSDENLINLDSRKSVDRELDCRDNGQEASQHLNENTETMGKFVAFSVLSCNWASLRDVKLQHFIDVR